MSKFRSLFGGKIPDAPPLPPVTTRDDPEIEEARRREREAQRLRVGRRSQILTSGAGDTAPLGSVSRPQAGSTLLGGG